MANDGGKIALIEAAIVTMLEAATLSSETVFRTVDHWSWQLSSTEAFRRYSPFAFIHYAGMPETGFEGNHDLTQHLLFAVLIGTEISNADESARIGAGSDASSRQLGISRLRDIVISTLQHEQPTGVTGVDYLECLGETIIVSEPNRCASELRFRCDYVDQF